MIDFDAEKKKFKKNMEFEELKDALASYDITDMDDVMFDIVKSIREKNKNNGTT